MKCKETRIEFVHFTPSEEAVLGPEEINWYEKWQDTLQFIAGIGVTVTLLSVLQYYIQGTKS